MEIEVEVDLLNKCIQLTTTFFQLRTKGAKPHSSFQLEKCDLTSLISGEWISSRVKYFPHIMVKSKSILIQQIIAAYLDLLQNSVHVSICMSLYSNPTSHYITRE